MSDYNLEQLAQTLFEESGDALFLFQPDEEQIIDVNPMAQRLSGFSRQELLHQKIASLFRSETAGGMNLLRRAYRKTGVFHSQEGYLLRCRQENVWIPVNLSVSRLHVEPRTLALITARDLRERRVAEAELRKANTTLRAFIQASPLAIYARDREGNITVWNPAAERIFGWSEQEALGHANATLLPEMEDRFRETFAHVLGGTSLSSHETRKVRKDGAQIDVNLSAAPLRDMRGEINGIFVIAEDITERKHAKEELRQTEERFRAFMDNSPCVAFVKDTEGRLVYYNRLFQCIFETSKSLIGATDFDLFSEEVAQHLQANDSVVRNENRVLETIEIVPTADGVMRHWLVFKFPIEDGDGGRFIGGVAIDVTERHIAEEALRQAERKYHSIFEHAIEGIYQSTMDGKFVTVNPMLAHIFGYDSPEALLADDRNFEAEVYVEPGRRAEFVRLLRERNALLNFESVIRRKDGTLVWVSENARSIRDAAGAILGFEGTLEDITERKKLEEQLRQSQKMEAVGQLAAGVAHEFNNLLTIILGNVSLLMEEFQDPTQGRELMQAIERSGWRAAELVRQLLGFSRRAMLRMQSVNLNAIVDETANILRRTFDPQVIVEVQPDPNLGTVMADPGQMSQIFMNLCLNARDAMPRGGRLLLQTENVVIDPEQARFRPETRPGEFARVRVTDTGMGIAPEHLPHVFEPFFSTKGVGKGSGLGLAMVFGIVQQHKGWIECSSEAGRGACFDIYLPQLPVQKKTDDPPSAGDTGDETILLVDDEAMIRNLGRTSLERHGYHVLLADDGIQAVNLYARERNQIDLVILDMVMPRLSGRDTLSRLQAINPDVRVLLCSGFSNERPDDLEADRFLGFIPKPFEAAELVHAVRQALDKSS